MKTVLAILLFAGCCYGQPFSVSDTAFLSQQASSSAFTLRSLPGLLLLVDYRDALTNNTQVGSITDEIGGMVFSQTLSTLQPTGTFNGLRFNGALVSGLTNSVGINIPTNFSFFAYARVDSSYVSAAFYGPLLANVTGPVGFYVQSNSRAADFYFGGDHLGSANNLYANDTWILWVWANGASYTNGVSAGTTTIISSYPVNLKTIGSYPGQQFGGNIKYIGVTTNTMSLADIARVWTYVQAH